jgi:crotonobetainyl-CoA:carnitine CoA-transferase CaiB-like acyl-CoA transferase
LRGLLTRDVHPVRPDIETIPATALGDVRVLDMTGPQGAYCTKLLADLGADVIRIEPPGGDPTRKLGPFFHDEPHPEKSLYFFHFNTNKRSITLNLDMEEGRSIFKRLITTADVLVETFPPGHLESLGLGYNALKEINPGLIFVSISPFGQTGPYRDFETADIVALALIGLAYTLGFPEDPPTTLGASQSYHMASANAAIGALMALLHRDMTGEGQWVDVPVHGTCLRMAEMVALMYWLQSTNRKRSGFEYYRGLRDLFPCKDGYIICSVLGGAGVDKVLEWMDSEGMAADLREPVWAEVIAAIKGVAPGRGTSHGHGKESASKPTDMREHMQHVEAVWQAFLMTHTKEELFVGAQTRGIVLMPVNTVKDIVEDVGLQERKYFVDVVHPELGESLKYPGPPYRLSETPWRLFRRAPLIGEQNVELYEKELGLTKERLAVMRAADVF